MTTFAEKFAQTLEGKYGKNFRHVNLDEKIDFAKAEGNPKATCWDSHGDIEVVKFDDDSTYEPTEVVFCKYNKF